MAILMTVGMPSRGIIPPKLPGHYIRHIIYWLPSWQMCQRCSPSLFLLLETSLCRSFFLVPIPSTFVVEIGLYKCQITSWEILYSVPRVLELVFVYVGWSELKVILTLCKLRRREGEKFIAPLILKLNTRGSWIRTYTPVAFYTGKETAVPIG